MNRFNSKLDTAEEITDEPKDKSEKANQNEAQRGKICIWKMQVKRNKTQGIQ